MSKFILDGICARRRQDGRSGRRSCFGRTRTPDSAVAVIRARCGRLTLATGVPRADDGVDENEQLPGAGDQRALVHFSGGLSAAYKGQ